MAATFKGGFHIRDHKELTNTIPTKRVPDCDMHIFPMRQHIGAPLKPLVQIGDKVKVGQKIADSEEFVSAPVHSSVSGTVTDIQQYFHDSTAMVDAIFVKNDKEYTVSEDVCPKDYTKMTTEEILKTIREAGIVGMGGAGFPTHVKLAPRNKVDYVIINGAECEPYITSDHRYMLENADDIIYGLKIAMKALGLSDGHIGVELNKPDGMEALKASKEYGANIHIIALKTKYPQGAEKQLIKAVTGRNVPAGKLPADAGAVVVNVATAVAIANAFKTGMPAIEKNVTVSGDAVQNPSNFRVRTGVPVKFLIEQAGGFKNEPEKIVSGGPMMGISQYNTDYPVTKTTSSVLTISKAEKTYDPDSPCIRCGRCVDHCPMRLMPFKLSEASRKDDIEMARKYNILECIECGLCSYICPANKNLLQFIRMIKPEVMKKVREEQKNGK
ncbi:MAG: electron transport complex subunit RsxC [Clostridia bacterium]|nr:electron transport complex subunit RsxC [Clostridia bacterium]MBQ9599028.1 electron transport complex subunit RsxC [Clostridia bacterium]